MTNRQLIEYMRACGIKIEGMHRKHELVLNSDVSIKDFLNEFMGSEINEWDLLLKLFRTIDEKEELKSVLKEIVNIEKAYKKYLSKRENEIATIRMYVDIMHNGINKEAVNKYRKIRVVEEITLDNIRYDVKYKNDKIVLLKRGVGYISDIRAILFKDNTSEIMKEDCKESYGNYELAIVANIMESV